MKEKIKVGIIGPGNIGTDLFWKIKRRSKILEVDSMIGVDPGSKGISVAKENGVFSTCKGLDGAIHRKDVQIYFDATGARFHHEHAIKLKKANKIVIDLTPAALGPFVVPPVNFGEHGDKTNVNLVTCGGQATIPIVSAISKVANVEYAEIIAAAASKSAGPGTRQNIDEYTQTTKFAMEKIGRAQKAKAIIILNPAEPPIMMRNTIYVLVEKVDKEAIREAVLKMENIVQDYVPGYRVKVGPEFEGNRVTTIVEVEGAGDFLPKYSGNLDIITAAAVRVGELFGEKILKGEIGNEK